jgi:predicted nucleic acid-binding protein
MHDYVLGELAIGNLRDWDRAVTALAALPRAKLVPESDWLWCVRRNQLAGTGLGFVDAHLLASVEASDGMRLWTRDKRLASAASVAGRLADLD